MLPFSLSIQDQKIYFLDRDIATISREPALDVRATSVETPLFEMDMTAENLPQSMQDLPVTFLFHPSFCHSTLLATLLHENRVTMINELLLFHQLEGLMDAGGGDGQYAAIIDLVLDEIYHLNNKAPFVCKLDTLLLARALLARQPRAKVLLLMPPLQQYIFHILGKHDRQAWCEDQFFRYRALCGLEHIQPQSDIEYIVGLWACSDHILKDIAAKQPSHFVQSTDLLVEPVATTEACLQFLGCEPNAVSLEALRQHSKTQNQFSPEVYQGLLEEFCTRHQDELAVAHCYLSDLGWG